MVKFLTQFSHFKGYSLTSGCLYDENVKVKELSNGNLIVKQTKLGLSKGKITSSLNLSISSTLKTQPYFLKGPFKRKLVQSNSVLGQTTTTHYTWSLTSGDICEQDKTKRIRLNVDFKCSSNNFNIDVDSSDTLNENEYKVQLLDTSEKCKFDIQVEMDYFCHQMKQTENNDEPEKNEDTQSSKFCGMVQKIDSDLALVYNFTRLSSMPFKAGQLNFKLCYDLNDNEVRNRNPNDCIVSKSNNKFEVIEDSYRLRLNYSLSDSDSVKKCQVKHLLIDLVCDKSKKGDVKDLQPSLISFEQDNKAHVEIKTSSACAVAKIIDSQNQFKKCLYYPLDENQHPDDFNEASKHNTDDSELENKLNGVLDLSESDFFYEQVSFFADTSKNQKFLLNLCGSGLKEPNKNCPNGTSVCVLDHLKSVANSQFSAGSLNSSIINKKSYYHRSKSTNSTYLLFENGSVCLNNPKKNYSSQINLKCDSKTDETESMPVFLKFDSSLCRYMFEWSTYLACFQLPVNNSSPKNDPVPAGLKQCVIFSNLHNHLFNLSDVFTPSDQPSVQTNRHEYFLNVCSPTIQQTDQKTVSVVRQDLSTKQNVKFGFASHMTMSHMSSHILLNYEGDVCDSSQNRSVLIVFECSPFQDLDPMLADETECDVTIRWPIRSACVFKKSKMEENGDQNSNGSDCSIYYAGHLYDLRPLVHLYDSWEVTNMSNVYWMNICKGELTFLVNYPAFLNISFSKTDLLFLWVIQF